MCMLCFEFELALRSFPRFLLTARVPFFRLWFPPQIRSSRASHNMSHCFAKPEDLELGDFFMPGTDMEHLELQLHHHRMPHVFGKRDSRYYLPLPVFSTLWAQVTHRALKITTRSKKAIPGPLKPASPSTRHLDVQHLARRVRQRHAQ